jgi:hypothetical protein
MYVLEVIFKLTCVYLFGAVCTGFPISTESVEKTGANWQVNIDALM